MGNREYSKIHFEDNDPGQNEVLIALLSEAGYYGFEETKNSLSAYIEQQNFDEIELNKILEIINVKYTKSVIKEQNWNAEWEQGFEPVQVNKFASIRAGFHAPLTDVEHEIIITPKMSFGTGHHATTWLMMEQMSRLDFTGKSVLDFGTGTGVLAILAEKMGAINILAIDNDDWSIENARENIMANGADKIVIEKASAISPLKKYDIILANINLNVILASMPEIAQSIKAGGKILLSGFLEADIPAIENELKLFKLEPSSITNRNGWVCVLALSN